MLGGHSGNLHDLFDSVPRHARRLTGGDAAAVFLLRGATPQRGGAAELWTQEDTGNPPWRDRSP